MGRDAVAPRLAFGGRIVRQPEGELAPRETGREPVLRQAERQRERRQDAHRQPVHRLAIFEQRFAEAGQVLRPAVGACEALPGERVVGAALALDEERLVHVGQRVFADPRGAHVVARHRHVAVIVLVHQQGVLGRRRLGVEPFRFREGPPDELPRYAVIHQDEKSDMLQRVRERAGHLAPASGEVDQGDYRSVSLSDVRPEG